MLHKYIFFATILAMCSIFTQETYSSIGTLFPLSKSTLGSTIGGRIIQISCEIGEVVQANQVLATIDQTLYELSLQEAIDAQKGAAIELEDAERNFQRMQKLFEKTESHSPAISKKRFEDATMRLLQAQVAKDKADQNRKKAEKNIEETVIKAPYDGIITKKFVDPGEIVSFGSKIAQIAVINRLYVEFALPMAYQRKIKNNHTISIHVDGNPSLFESKIDRIYPEVDEKTRTIQCRGYINNPENILKAGAFVTISLQFDEE